MRKGPTDKIKAIVCGKDDSYGNKIVDVIDTGDEFAIYEIDHPDINERLRVEIEGRDDDSQKALLAKFNRVSQKYIEAKGLLYRSSNFGMMKHRVAHLLGKVLSSESIDGNAEFDRLILAIQKEANDAIRNRTNYLFPCIAITGICFVLALLGIDLRTAHNPYWQVITALLASLLGGSMSILYNVRKLNFEEYTESRFYFLLGVERTFLAIAAGGIAFILIKAQWILPEVANETYWGVMASLVVAAFSESLIPSVLKKRASDFGKIKERNSQE